MVYQTISPEAIKWVETELDPFVENSILSLAPPHALLHYCVAGFPQSQTHRKLFYAIEDYDGRRTRLPLSFPDGNQNVVHPMNDVELTNFSNLYGQIIAQFSTQPSPLYMARRFRAEDTVPEDRSLVLLASIYFGANLKYPWT